MATITNKIDLSTTPLRDWPPRALMAEAKRTARLWSNHPAFNPKNGGIFSDHEDRADEITVRVLDYSHKKPVKDGIDQVTFFHQIARYCKPGIIQDSYSIPSATEGIEGDGGDETDYPKHEIVDPDTARREEEDAERKEKLQNLLRKIGVGERDFALFDTSNADLIEATGCCERKARELKDLRKKEIIKMINSLAGGDEIVREMNKSPARASTGCHAVKMFYYTDQDGLSTAIPGKSTSKLGTLRFHWVDSTQFEGAAECYDEYEVREWEPGDRWVYKCRVLVRVRSSAAMDMDMDRVFGAFKMQA